MYKIIGADGKEYGPVTTDILKQWIADGRVNAQTKVLAEGATEWKTVAELPELATAQPTLAPPTIAPLPSRSNSPGLSTATDLVNGPGIGLIVTGALNVLLGLLRIVFSLAGVGMGAFGGPGLGNDEMTRMIMGLAGTAGAILGVLGVVCGGLTLFSGVKLRQLQSYGLCMTGSILAMIPCTSPCCLIGLPVGIWTLVVMSKPEVKSQFR
jgi:hypothetical protein